MSNDLSDQLPVNT